MALFTVAAAGRAALFARPPPRLQFLLAPKQLVRTQDGFNLNRRAVRTGYAHRHGQGGLAALGLETAARDPHAAAQDALFPSDLVFQQLDFEDARVLANVGDFAGEGVAEFRNHELGVVVVGQQYVFRLVRQLQLDGPVRLLVQTRRVQNRNGNLTRAKGHRSRYQIGWIENGNFQAFLIVFRSHGRRRRN